MDIRELILSAASKPMVPVQAFGVALYVKVMSGTERNAWEVIDPQTRKANFRASLLVYCLADETGKLVFKPEDATALAEKDGTELDRLFDIAFALNELGADKVDDVKKN